MMTALIFALLITYSVPMSINGAFTLTPSGDLLKGSNISIVCNIPSFLGTAGWINPSISDSSLHTCSSGFCFPSNPSYPRYTFSVTASTFTVTITNVEPSDATWICDYPSDNGTITLDIKVAPTVCTISKTGNTYTCITSCGYPDNDVYIEAKLNGTVSAENVTLAKVSEPSCTSPESAFSGIIPSTLYQQNGHLYCTCGVNPYPSVAITSDSLIVAGTPTTPPPSPCRCGWDWLPCDWECYHFYIIIAAVVVVVVFLLVVGVCCCCRCSDDDAEAYVCCMRKKKSRKDSVNLNENENGQKNVPRSSENGRQVNPSESGKENTSESPCHNNPAYFESEGTDM